MTSVSSIYSDLELSKPPSYLSSHLYLTTRAKQLKIHDKPVEQTLWDIKPPDFRLQNYLPKPEKRRDYIRRKLNDSKNQLEAETVNLTEVTHISMDKSNRIVHPDFILSIRNKRPFTAKKEFCKFGTLPRDNYKPPIKHIHRELISLDQYYLPEFTCRYERDPFNNKLHTDSIGIIKGKLADIVVQRDTGRDETIPRLRVPGKTDRSLFLPPNPWPNVTKEFSRYRILNQDPQKSFMDRVEQIMTDKWSKDKPSFNQS